jgi:hypothetical protein
LRPRVSTKCFISSREKPPLTFTFNASVIRSIEWCRLGPDEIVALPAFQATKIEAGDSETA